METKSEIKKEARKAGINVNSIENTDNGVRVEYYAFDEEKRYRTENKTSYFSSMDEIENWIKSY